MQFLVFIAALLSTVAVAQRSSTVNRQCATRYSLKPTSRIRTTTYRATRTRTIGRTVVVNPVTTVTDAAATVVTTTSVGSFVTVTAASSTDTFTSFQTVTSTSTFTAVQSFTTATTVLSTTTIAGVTSSIPAPAGFTALADTPGFLPKKRNAVQERREPHLDSRANAVQGHIPMLAEVGGKLSKRQSRVRREYPVGIQCTYRTTYFATRTATSTAGTTQTVTVVAPVVTSTITLTQTGTFTVVPADATRVITVTTAESATTTSTLTTVTTLSATVTIQAPAATVLAQCATNNQVSTAFAGNRIGTLTFNGDFTLQSIQVANPATGYDCCAVCAGAANCAGYAQAPPLQGNVCYYVTTDGRCDATQTFGDTYNYYQINTPGYTVGNAQCGQLAPVAGPPRTADFAPGA